jgi:hypothetical protein
MKDMKIHEGDEAGSRFQRPAVEGAIRICKSRDSIH